MSDYEFPPSSERNPNATDEEGFDWTQGQDTAAAQAGPKVTVPAADFEIADVDTGVNADEVAKEAEERRTHPVPPGIHKLVVLGFFGDPELVCRYAFIDGQRYEYESFSVNVKFGVAGNTHLVIGDYFVLPPSDPDGLTVYLRGKSSLTSSDEGGFNAKKFAHFLNRLFPGEYPQGSTKLPPVARKLSNWSGRTIYAEVFLDEGRRNARNDPRTGKPYKAKTAIRVMSYSSQPIVLNNRLPNRAPQSGPGQPLPGQQAFASMNRQATPSPMGASPARPEGAPRPQAAPQAAPHGAPRPERAAGSAGSPAASVGGKPGLGNL